MGKVKIEDVALKAGVSKTTVSRVLNNRGPISEKTRNKVFAAMDEIGYYPNEIARSLFGNKTNTVGVLLPNVADPFFGAIATKLELLLYEKNYKVLLCNTENNLEKETHYLKMLLANQVDGIIVSSHNEPSSIYAQAKLPIVAIDRFVSKNIPIVRSDNYGGGCLATEYLIKSGCQKIALFAGSRYEEVQKGELRSKGYRDTIQKYQRQEMICYVDFDRDLAHQKKEITRFLAAHPQIDGAFVTGDTLAALVQQLAREVGKEIKIVGYDGTHLFSDYIRDFVTIQQPLDNMMNKSVDILLKAIEGNYEEDCMEHIFPVSITGPAE